MIKITDIWTSKFSEFVKDIEDNIQNIHLVIIDALHEANYSFNNSKPELDRLLNVTLTHNVPIKIIHSGSRSNTLQITRPNVEVICWDTFWFRRTYLAWCMNKSLNIDKGIDFTNPNVCKDFELNIPYICLNNIVKIHRCKTLDLLAKYDIIKHGAITWRGKHHGNYQYKFNYWKPNILLLDQDLNVRFNQETMPLEFNHSFMQLVTESMDDILFFTEKTATPIFLNKPFLIVGAANFHKELSKLGFELYDELFDYSFDGELNDDIRYEKIVKNINRYVGLTPIELKKVYDSVDHKLKKNRELALRYANEIPTEVKELSDIIAKNIVDYSGPLNTNSYMRIL